MADWLKRKLDWLVLLRAKQEIRYDWIQEEMNLKTNFWAIGFWKKSIGDHEILKIG
jgi:hypothetical protein